MNFFSVCHKKILQKKRLKNSKKDRKKQTNKRLLKVFYDYSRIFAL